MHCMLLFMGLSSLLFLHFSVAYSSFVFVLGPVICSKRLCKWNVDTCSLPVLRQWNFSIFHCQELDPGCLSLHNLGNNISFVSLWAVSFAAEKKKWKLLFVSCIIFVIESLYSSHPLFRFYYMLVVPLHQFHFSSFCLL